jgi:nicotinate-nucleotide adenylyltransferase
MIDTVEYLSDRLTCGERFGLIVGDDLVKGLPTWRRWPELIEMVDLLVAHRTSVACVRVPYPHRYLDNPLIEVSSSGIRDRVARGLPIEHLVPSVVAHYIAAHDLYRHAP